MRSNSQTRCPSHVCTSPDILSKRLETYKGCSVVNLSSLSLDQHTLTLLSYGLSFCPTPRRDNKALVIENIQKFLRKIKLRGFFMDDQPSVSSSQHTLATETNDAIIPLDDTLDHRDKLDSQFRFKSNWTPDHIDPNIALFSNVIRKELMRAHPKKHTHLNTRLT